MRAWKVRTRVLPNQACLCQVPKMSSKDGTQSNAMVSVLGTIPERRERCKREARVICPVPKEARGLDACHLTVPGNSPPSRLANRMAYTLVLILVSNEHAHGTHPTRILHTHPERILLNIIERGGLFLLK